MRTNKQNQASRINGAKSKGPTTEVGKQKSAKNATTHGLSGLTGHIVLLRNESQAIFDAYTRAFMQRFKPIDIVEEELVQQLIASTWRLRRIEAAETAIIELELDEQREQIDETFEFIDEAARNGLAFRSLAENSLSLDRLMRYRAQARRAFVTNIKLLQLLQGSRFNATPIDPDDPCSLSPQTAPAFAQAETESHTKTNKPDPLPNTPSTVSFCRKPLQNQTEPNEPEPFALPVRTAPNNTFRARAAACN